MTAKRYGTSPDVPGVNTGVLDGVEGVSVVTGQLSRIQLLTVERRKRGGPERIPPR